MVKRFPPVGILAFQGDVAEHADILASLGAATIEVRTLQELDAVDCLVIPGGESTVIGSFLWQTGLAGKICERLSPSAKRPLSVFGTCAGAILLARSVKGKNPPKALKIIDMTIDRNAYGTQAQSFEAEIKVRGIRAPVSAAFIRAPRITSVGRNVEVLATLNGEPVLVRQGRALAGTFHTEVRGDGSIHKLFLDLFQELRYPRSA